MNRVNKVKTNFVMTRKVTKKKTGGTVARSSLSRMRTIKQLCDHLHLHKAPAKKKATKKKATKKKATKKKATKKKAAKKKKTTKKKH